MLLKQSEMRLNLKKIVDTWKLYLTELYQILLIMLIGGVFGVVVVRIGVSVDSTVEGYVIIGAFIAVCLGMFVKLMSDIFSFGSKFELAISMGCTRREFLSVYWVENVLFAIVEIAAAILFGILETQLGRILYAGTSLSVSLNLTSFLLNYKVITGLSLLVPAVGMFLGTFMLKFQRKAFWVLWAIWMTAFLGCGKISNIVTKNPDSMLSNIIKGIPALFKTIAGPVWILLFIAVCAVLFLVSAVLLRRQEVR